MQHQHRESSRRAAADPRDAAREWASGKLYGSRQAKGHAERDQCEAVDWSLGVGTRWWLTR